MSYLRSNAKYLPNEEVDTNATHECVSTCRTLKRRQSFDVREVKRTPTILSSSSRKVHSVLPNISKLPNGEDYFIYRFALFSDGSASSLFGDNYSDALYLKCLNFPEQHRNSDSIVRVLGLAPKHTSVYRIPELLFQDIATGNTIGFTDFDTDGKKRRIFWIWCTSLMTQ